MWGKILRLVLLIPLAPLLFALVYVALCYISLISPDQIIWFLIPFLLALPVWLVWFSSFEFWGSFHHEMAHLTLAKMMGRRIKSLLVTVDEDSDRGGEVVLFRRPNSLIRLAPYYFPFFTVLFLLVKPFVSDGMNDLFNALIGVSLAFHYAFLFRDFRLRQTDITDTGLPYSVIMTIVLNVVMLVIVLAVVMNAYVMILDYFADSFLLAGALYREIWQGWQSGNFAWDSTNPYRFAGY